MESKSSINISFGMRINDLQTAKKLTKKTLLANHKMKGYTAFVNGDVFMPNNKIVKADLLFKDRKLVAINDFDEKEIPARNKISLINLKNKYLTPAIVDQHIHGGLGINFNTAKKNEVETFLKKTHKLGYSEILATLIPDKIENLNRQIDILSSIMKSPKKDSTHINGINLEGPFFNPKKAGIHVPEMLMTPSIENFNKIKSDDVRMVTVAPELDKDYKLTKYLNSKGIITSAGHTLATAADVKNANIKQVTHLYNAMPGIHHRELSVANEALHNNKMYIELNSDLSLVSPEMVDLTVKMKPKDKIILISDALEGTHSGKDCFYMNGVKVDIIDDIAKNSNGTLAGSIKFLSDMAKRIVDETKVTFKDFIRFSSINPAKNLGIEKNYKFKIDSEPKFMVWDKKTLKPEKTFNA